MKDTIWTDLISAAFKNISLIDSDKYDISKRSNPYDFVREHHTLIMGLPRQTGKTTYIQNNARHSDLIVVPNLFMKNMQYRNKHNAITLEVFCGLHYTSTFHTKRQYYPVIWFDECIDKLPNIYDALPAYITDPNQKVIMLGTS